MSIPYTHIDVRTQRSDAAVALLPDHALTTANTPVNCDSCKMFDTWTEYSGSAATYADRSRGRMEEAVRETDIAKDP